MQEGDVLAAGGIGDELLVAFLFHDGVDGEGDIGVGVERVGLAGAEANERELLGEDGGDGGDEGFGDRAVAARAPDVHDHHDGDEAEDIALKLKLRD